MNDRSHIKKLSKLSPSVIKALFFIGGGYGSYRIIMYGYDRFWNGNSNPKVSAVDVTASSKEGKPGHDMKRFIKLLNIILPGIRTKEFALLSIHSLALITRAVLSIYVATLDGRLTKSIVEKNLKKFIISLSQWIGIAIPATFINSLLKYLEGKISLAFRARLTKHAYDLYFSKQTYYKVGNLDSRLSAVDESLTEDLNLFCQSVSHLYSHLTKPVLDLTLVTVTVIKLAGNRGQSAYLPGAIAMLVTIGTGQIIKKSSPPFGRIVAEESARRGCWRTAHSRVITHAEEIAFYSGHEKEQSLIMNCYQSLADQINVSLNQKLWYVMLEQFLMKYVWSAAGLIMVSLPIMLGTDIAASDADQLGDRSRAFTIARNLLLSGADAIERLISSLKEVVELAGHTDRVCDMLNVFEDIHSNNFVRVSSEISLTVEEKLSRASNCPGSFKYGEVLPLQLLPQVNPDYTDGCMRLKNVPIIAPSGDVVCPRLSIKISPGTHFLLTGPNGCGKSSLFRILSGIWPVYGGELSIPFPQDMFYIPQRPYMSIGTFRDQVIYPHSINDMVAKGWKDGDRERILETVHLSHVLRREKGWDSVNDWMDVLSGGEKQRMAMARMFYHMPKFALLDECTSAVSIDVEEKIYQSAKDIGITLLTITHRPTLWKFHDRVLKFDGQGNWYVEDMNSSSLVSLKEEKEKLEAKLADVPAAKERLKELCATLGGS